MKIIVETFNTSVPLLGLMTTEESAEPKDECATTMFFFVIYGPIYGTVCALGLVGNSLSFAILHKYSRDSVATYLLNVLAIVDNIFLAISSSVLMFAGMALYFGYTEELLTPIYPQMQAFVWPTVHTVQLGAVWMMVLVAANRYIAVCRPLHAARLCSKRNVTRQMSVTFVCVVLFNLPRFAEYRYVDVFETSLVDGVNVTSPVSVNVGLASFRLYNILYENIAYVLVVFLLPLGILIVLNGHLVRELKRAQRSRSTLIGRASAEENNITLVMIIIIISFIVCETPASINQVLYFLVSDRQRETCSIYRRYFHVSNLLITTNSSLNFVIYCLFRRQFQHELKQMICGPTNRGAMKLRRAVVLRPLHRGSAKVSGECTEGAITPLSVGYSFENTPTTAYDTSMTNGGIGYDDR